MALIHETGRVFLVTCFHVVVYDNTCQGRNIIPVDWKSILPLECHGRFSASSRYFRSPGSILFRRGQLRSYVPLLTSIASKSLTAEKPFVRALTARLVHELLLYSALDQKLHVLRAMLEILSQDISYQVRQAAFYGSETDVGVSVDA